MKDKKCVFCKILNAELPASFLWRDEFCAAFLDIQPINTGHILVIPLEHEPLLGDLDPETVAHMLKIGQKMVQALRASSLPCEGVNLFLADGEPAGQEIFHSHLHVFPRYKGDGFGFHFGPHYRELPTREALDEVASELRGILGRKGDGGETGI